MSDKRFKFLTSLIATAGILAVGMIDYLTGVELRIYPFYFVPLIYGAWHCGKLTAFTMAGITTAVWSLSMFLGGRRYLQTYIWVINITTQASAFLLVTVLVALLRDALQREHALGRSDSLTGLPNRRAFFEQAQRITAVCHRHQHPITLAYLDLDNFKRANDTFGHERGDQILRDVAAVLSTHFRSSDLVARFGGDEFVILLPETPENNAREALEKVRKSVAQHPTCQRCGVTASIGAVASGTAPADIAPLISAADRLMYQVKAAGKNRFDTQTVNAI